MNDPLKTVAFTIRHAEIAEAIYSEARVSHANLEASTAENEASTKALWDTGATHSCISDRLARKLGLVAVDYAHVATASGIEHVPTYFTHLYLSRELIFRNWELMQFQYCDDDSDIINGMDIITQGDFSISNLDGRTVCSFRLPSQHLVDFEEELPT